MKMNLSPRDWKNTALFLIIILIIPDSFIAGQDSEVRNIKSGISLNWSGIRGVDFAEEYFYFDEKINDHKVIYIHEDTLIEMAHNENNIAGAFNGADKYVSVDPDIGAIMWKPDGDGRYNIEANSWSAYSEPIAFSEINYGVYGEPSLSVVGSTGDNGVAQNLTTKDTYLHYGIIDSVGDEWHTITVADDDSAHITGGDSEFDESDGKVFLFVVNPKTPCLTWRASGNGEFYTTPAKNYFLPHIFEQTTYFTGTVSLEITDINGNNVFYRINGGSFTNTGANTAVLNQDEFVTGTNTLEYYYEGNESYTKIRTVVKDPGYPSAGETHGDRLWNSAEDWSTYMEAEMKGSWWISQWRNDDRHKNHAELVANRKTGKRSLATRASFKNAIVARTYGMKEKYSPSSTYTYARAAKYILLEPLTVLDPVGAEINTSLHPVPTRELQYRGYYDVQPIYEYAATYDILVGYFRADQGYANGVTVIEDYYIRDMLARYVHNCGMLAGGYSSTTSSDAGGMWDTARKTGAAFITCMMPSYSTPYYGTSGLDGNKTTYTEILFPTLKYTWYDLFLDNNKPVVGYPDLNNKMGVDDYLFIEDNGELKWHDRLSYADTPLMGQTFGIYYNLLKLFHPTKSLPTVEAAMIKAANGNLRGKKVVKSSDANPRFFSWAVMLNSWHPTFRSIAQPKALALDSSHGQSPGKQASSGGEFYVLWYDKELPLGNSAPTEQTVASPSFSPPGGKYPYSATQNVIISTATTGATIHYTTDGSEPNTDDTIYSAPVVISGETTIKVLARLSGYKDSNVATAIYSFEGPSVVERPIISPDGGDYIEDVGVSISISTGTADADIYYTTDGTTPTSSSTRYTEPFSITNKGITETRAIAVKPNSENSDIAISQFNVGQFTSTTDWENIPFTSRTSNFSFFIQASVNSSDTNAVLCLGNGPSTAYQDNPILLRFTENGEINAFNSTWYSSDELVTYSANTIYTFQVIVDTNAFTYDVWIKSDDNPAIQLANDFAYRNSQPTENSFNNFGFITETNPEDLLNIHYAGFSNPTISVPRAPIELKIDSGVTP